jgi:phage FluMu protein Com
MKCRKCNKELEEQDTDQYRMVASWPFCLECFQGLLDAPPDESDDVTRKEAAPRPPSPQVEAAMPEASTPRCHLCNRELAEGQHERLWIWTFCPECYAGLTAPPETEAQSEETDRVEVRASVQPEPLKFVLCQGCGRRIPERGSKPVDGDPYCPDCYQALGDSEPEAETAAEEPVEDASPQTCESCQRQEVPQDQMAVVEGFLICRACLSTDARLALQIARIRHMKHLQRIKDEID